MQSRHSDEFKKDAVGLVETDLTQKQACYELSE